MEIKRYVTGIVALALAVILVATVMAPVIGSVSGDGSSGGSKTYNNEGAYFSLVSGDHTINVILQDGEYIVSTDGAETRELDMYVPQTTGVAPAIGIGVYEAYSNGGVLVSQSGRTPTASQTIDTFRTQALAGNTDVTEGTYQLWNFYQYTLMKMMGLTVMGNTDSQYMMGAGIINGSKTNTGATSSAYQKSTSGTTAESLFVENGWGNVNEFVGDVNFNNYVINIGNTLGGNTIASVEGVNTTAASIPTSSGNFINTINMNPDVWGIPLTATSSTEGTAGQGINDREYSSSGNRLLNVGGSWSAGSDAGLSSFSARTDLGSSNNYLGSRLAYVMMGAGDAPTGDYGYVITFDTTSGQTVISNVQSLKNGVLTSYMPTGTILNPYWDFDTATGIGPFGSYYAAINLSSGANGDDSAEARLSTQKGEIAYILNPNNLKQTLNGTTFDPTLYNVMIIIPTAYWYSDPATNKLYIGSSADYFDGITMVPYAHSYTIDPDVDTGNPPKEVEYASTSLVMGDSAIVRLYANGEIKVITATGTDSMGIADSAGIAFTLSDDVLSYTSSDTTAKQVSGMLAYVTSEGDYVYAHNPTVAEDTEIIIGGVTHDLATTGSATVDIGYCASGEFGSFGSDSVTAILDPSSSGGAAYQSTEVTVNSTETDGAYRVDNILFTSTWSDDSTSTATYTYFLAPATVTVESGGGGGVGTVLSNLLSVIPLITIVGIIVATIGWLKLRY